MEIVFMSVSMMLTAMLDASVILAISSIVCMVKDVLVGNLRMILVRVCTVIICLQGDKCLTRIPRLL